jgi:hypothetical protein
LGPSWSYGSWIYNYLCNQCLSPLKLWVWMPFSWGVLDTTLCDKVCRATGQWFTPISSTNKTDSHEITEKFTSVWLGIIQENLSFIGGVRNWSTWRKPHIKHNFLMCKSGSYLLRNISGYLMFYHIIWIWYWTVS